MEKKSDQLAHEKVVATIKPFASEIAIMAITGSQMANEPSLDWRMQGLCGQTDPELFFPEKGGSVDAAKKVCARCEVEAQCLEDALENDDQYGVRGGKSYRERRSLLKKRRAA